MHGHISEVIKDYGPVYAFWLFSYERYNGILGFQPNNNRAIEPQLMSRFVQDSYSYTYNFPQEYSQDFSSLCSTENDSVGSLADTLSEELEKDVKFTSAGKRDVFDDGHKKLVENLYQKLNPSDNNISVNSVFVKYRSAILKGKKYGCSHGRNPCIAIALWDNDLFVPPPTRLPNPTHPDCKLRLVKVHNIIKASVKFNVQCDESKSVSQFILAVVSWFKPHLNNELVGKPAQIWSHNDFENGGICSFLPVKDLRGRCAFATEHINDDHITVIVPLVE